MKYLYLRPHWAGFSALTILLIVGCQSTKSPQVLESQQTFMPAVVVAPPTTSIPETTKPAVVRDIVRINAGSSAPLTGAQGHRWLADQYFYGGDTIERPELAVANTTEPNIYRSEHYSMESFSCALPNGSYQVKLHFCEGFEGVTGPGQRVFSFNVQGREFPDFDVWAKAGGPFTALVEIIPVEIKNGKLLIKFTPKIENPQINGIEIIPQF